MQFPKHRNIANFVSILHLNIFSVIYVHWSYTIYRKSPILQVFENNCVSCFLILELLDITLDTCLFVNIPFKTNYNVEVILNPKFQKYFFFLEQYLSIIIFLSSHRSLLPKLESFKQIGKLILINLKIHK